MNAMNSQAVFPTFLLLLYVTALQGDHKLQTTSLPLPTMERDYDYAQIGLFKRKDVGKPSAIIARLYTAMLLCQNIVQINPATHTLVGRGVRNRKLPLHL